MTRHVAMLASDERSGRNSSRQREVVAPLGEPTSTSLSPVSVSEQATGKIAARRGSGGLLSSRGSRSPEHVKPGA